MMWKKREEPQWPTPLRARRGGLGKIVRDYVENTDETRGEAAAYTRVLAQTVGTHSRRPRRIATVSAGLAMVLVLVAGAMVLRHRAVTASKSKAMVASQSPRVSSPARPSAAETALLGAQRSPAPAIPAISATKTASLRLRDLPSVLPAGRVDLDGQAVAVLSEDAAASGRMHDRDTEILLKKGTIDLRVLPRAQGHGFSVRAGLYQFTVVGTAFTVSQTRSRLELVVDEGKVAVSRGSKRVAMVGAGGKWAVEVNPASTAALPQVAPTPDVLDGAQTPTAPSHAAFATAPIQTAPSPTALVMPPAPAVNPPAPSAPAPMPAAPLFAAASGAASARAATPSPAAHPRRDCGQIAASKRTDEALLCYQEQAAQSGLAGETAQYEVARLWRDSLGDPERALAAFKDQRSRFPRGTLRTEADLSIIEILPRLGRHTEVMAETEQFLLAHPNAERRGEIHLLRGNIFREVLHDLQQAEREYARGSASRGRAGDECRFLRAVCLEAQGRLEEARTAYETYLLGSKGTHVQDAKDRLERLRP